MMRLAWAVPSIPSADDTVKVAKEHGAKVQNAVLGVEKGAYAIDARHDWILCLLPNEALSEGLEASLYTWKDEDHDADTAFSMAIREEASKGWKQLGSETRLVNRTKINWTDALPTNTPDCPQLPGDLLRFHQP
jgi:hypothetical protein